MNLLSSLKTSGLHRFVWPFIFSQLLFPVAPSLASDSASTPITDNIVVEPPRAFGYTLGDVLTQRIELSSGQVKKKLDEPLPLERTGPWLERQSSNFVTDNLNRNWLELKYQIVNSPESVVSSALPPLTLRWTDGVTIEVSPWPFSLGPLTTSSEEEQSNLPSLQANRSPPLPDMLRMERWLRHALQAALFTVVAWLSWWLWRQYLDSNRLPFSEARFKLRKLSTVRASDNPDAWVLLHDAFNRYAGRTLQPAGIPELLNQQPWLKPLQERIEHFYSASSARFFAHPAKPETFELHDFSQALYLAEKRDAR